MLAFLSFQVISNTLLTNAWIQRLNPRNYFKELFSLFSFEQNDLNGLQAPKRRLFLAGPRKSVQINLLDNEILPSNQASVERLYCRRLMFSDICGPVPKPALTKHNLISFNIIFENQRNKFEVVWVRILWFISLQNQIKRFVVDQETPYMSKIEVYPRTQASGDWVSTINSASVPKSTRFYCRLRQLPVNRQLYLTDITAVGLFKPVSVIFDLKPATWPESELRIPKSFHGALI